MLSGNTEDTGVQKVVFKAYKSSLVSESIYLLSIPIMELMVSCIHHCFSNRSINNSLGNVPLAEAGKKHNTWRLFALLVDYDFPLIKSSAATQSSLRSALESKIHQ